jgi:(R,R)-butanediol dehydrogenase/meso-butanediol dehydrogenase/diacetyl reductase/L-iditol 2-dehydrogenase
MKEIFYTKPGLKVFSVKEPEVKNPNDIKIKIAYCAICGSDIRRSKGYFDLWEKERKVPIGHEPSGYIVDLGSDAHKEGFKVGDKVIFNFVIYCGKCRYCREGRENLCVHPTGVENALAEYVVIRSDHVFKVDNDANMKTVPLIEPLSVCLHAIKKLDICPGSMVAVNGGGAIGQIMMQLAKRAGAERVTVIEPAPKKRQIALATGADFVIDTANQTVIEEAKRITDNYLYDAVIECSGDENAVKTVYDIAGVGSTIEYISMYPPGVTLNGIDLHKNFLEKKDIKIVTSFQAPYCFDRAVKYYKKLKGLESFVPLVFKPEQIEDAINAQDRGDCIRALVQFE